MASTQEMYSRMRSNFLADPNSIFWPLELMLTQLGLNPEQKIGAKNLILKAVEVNENEAIATNEMNVIISRLMTESGTDLPRKLRGRTIIIVKQIAEFVTGDSVLDFGCGPGEVSLVLSGGSCSDKEFQLYDKVDYRTKRVRDNVDRLPMTTDWSSLRGRSFTVGIDSAVLHHCEDPDQEIERQRLKCQRLIVIESVVDEVVMTWSTQAFVDWLYNRGMHPNAKIPVTGQFRSVEKWTEAFVRSGYKVILSRDLGIDIPIVPEHHWLFVLDRI